MSKQYNLVAGKKAQTNDKQSKDGQFVISKAQLWKALEKLNVDIADKLYKSTGYDTINTVRDIVTDHFVELIDKLEKTKNG